MSRPCALYLFLSRNGLSLCRSREKMMDDLIVRFLIFFAVIVGILGFLMGAALAVAILLGFQ
jgi:hypothetical protein